VDDALKQELLHLRMENAKLKVAIVVVFKYYHWLVKQYVPTSRF
jgi:hypothetical protein